LAQEKIGIIAKTGINMDARRKDNLITYLTTGQLHFVISSHPYFLSVPSIDCKIIAHTIYEETLYKNRFEKWYNHNSAFETLVRRGIISPAIDSNIKSMEERLEDLKVNLYKAMFSTSDEKKIKKEIKMVREKIEEQEKLRSDIYHLTLEGFAARIKFCILILGSLYDTITKQRVFTDDEIKMPDFFLVDSIATKRNEFEPHLEEIREIARTQPWRSIWSLGKPNPFQKPVIELTDHQQSLMLYSNMYDNIRESMDCPPDNIIEDDDCCDGWLIIQNRKREKELKEKQVEQAVGKTNAQELFIPAKNKEDVERITSMNDTGNKMILAQRKKQIEKAGMIKDGDLLDNRVKKQGIAIQQFKERAG
jgi:hypothetical protein